MNKTINPEVLKQKYPIEYAWIQAADEQLYDAVIGALERMANSGATPMTPPVFGAFVQLGVLDKKRKPAEYLEIFEMFC